MPKPNHTTKPKVTSKQQLAAMRNGIVATFTNPKKRRETILVILTLCILWVIGDLFVGGNIRFYAKWIECGRKPVVAGDAYETRVPHYVETSAFPILRLHPAQFCSPRDAELHAYSSDEYGYDFPHLTQEENVKVRKKYLY